MREILNLTWAYRAFGRFVGSAQFRDMYIGGHLRCQPGFRVLDLGCGPGDILQYLPDSIEYHGVDLNPSYIEFARRRYGNRGLFSCEAISPALDERFRGFDLVMANGVLHHLTEAEAGSLLDIARHALKSDGRLVTLDGVFIAGQSPLARFVVSQDRGRYVRAEEAYKALARPYFAENRSVVYDGRLRIPYTHLVMELSRPVPGGLG